MKTTLITILLYFSLLSLSNAQVGINTNTPQGALDVVSSDQGLVLPRVSDINNVTDGQGNAPVDGTMVYDTSTNSFCFRAAGQWVCTDATGTTTVIVPSAPPPFDGSSTSDYIKASNTEPNDQFGLDIDLSSDGNTLAVSAWFESSNATGVDGDQTNNAFLRSGAVYVYTRSGSNWTQQAYVKASNTNINAQFGFSLSLSNDGNILAVGARGDRSGSPGIGGDQTDVSQPASGAVYIFSRTGTNWAQTEFIKASNPELQDGFGWSVDLSGDGNTLAVSAPYEDSNAAGINGNQNDNSLTNSGAVYIFKQAGSVWSQQAYIKASNPDQNDEFGFNIALSSDSNTLVISAKNESSNATSINGNQSNNSSLGSGAAYVFTYNAGTWSQEAYLKASNANQGDQFGRSVAISSDGNTIAVGAMEENSNATGINGDEANNSLTRAGAAYIFVRNAGIWTQEAYVKASNTDAGQELGFSIALNSDGNKLAVGAISEGSNSTGINGDQNNTLALSSGAVYVFARNGTNWAQEAYVKATNTASGNSFGTSVALSANGDTIAIGSPNEASNATGINGDQNNVSATGAGAAYIYSTN